MPMIPYHHCRPTETQIAGAYLRIAHIYRHGNIPHLALDYYNLVMIRFMSLQQLQCRAQLFAVRCLIDLEQIGRARRLLRRLVSSPDATPAMACNAALKLLKITPDRDRQHAVLAQRLVKILTPFQFKRWQRLATTVVTAASKV